MPQPTKAIKAPTIPATIRRPGAETKVGGSPSTTIGFKAAAEAEAAAAAAVGWLRLCGVEAVEAQQSTSLRRRDGEGEGEGSVCGGSEQPSGTEAIQNSMD